MLINWEEFKAMIKVNFLLQILIFLGYFMLIDSYGNNKWWYYLDATLLFIYLLFTIMAFIAVNHQLL